MDLAAVATTELHRFLLCLARTGGLVAVSPVLGGRFVPAPARALLAVLLALVVFPVVPAVPPPASAAAYGAALLAELAAGLALGLATVLVFAAAQLAGQLLDLSTGFGISGTFDPVLGEPAPVLGNFFQLAMWLLFLAADGHHLVIRALAYSFRHIPPGGAGLVPAAPVVVELAGWMFATALMLSLPVLGVLLAVTAALSLIARAVPQMNVFITGLPVQVAVGLVALMAGLPALVGAMAGLAEPMGEFLARMVEAMAR